MCLVSYSLCFTMEPDVVERLKEKYPKGVQQLEITLAETADGRVYIKIGLVR